MNAVEFVRVIETIVRDASVMDTVSIVRSPPGRQPAPELLNLSEWYSRLDAGDQAMVGRMLAEVARQAVFGFLSVLAVARQVKPSESGKGYFELRYIKGDRQQILSGPAGEVLHELAR